MRLERGFKIYTAPLSLIAFLYRLRDMLSIQTLFDRG